MMAQMDPIVREYTALAPKYDSKWSFYIDASTAQTLARIPAVLSGRLLDVGCGTGALLERLAQSPRPLELFGLDPVPAMLDQARAKFGNRITLQTGWAERMQFSDEFFDAVVSCNMFHFVRQPAIALGEMKRVLKRGGLLVVTDWCDDYLACRICARMLRLFNRAHFRVYSQRACGRMLEEGGFAQIKSERFKINWLWGLMTATGNKPQAHA